MTIHHHATGKVWIDLKGNMHIGPDGVRLLAEVYDANDHHPSIDRMNRIIGIYSVYIGRGGRRPTVTLWTPGTVTTDAMVAQHIAAGGDVSIPPRDAAHLAGATITWPTGDRFLERLDTCDRDGIPMSRHAAIAVIVAIEHLAALAVAQN